MPARKQTDGFRTAVVQEQVDVGNLTLIVFFPVHQEQRHTGLRMKPPVQQGENPEIFAIFRVVLGAEHTVWAIRSAPFVDATELFLQGFVDQLDQQKAQQRLFPADRGARFAHIPQARR